MAWVNYKGVSIDACKLYRIHMGLVAHISTFDTFGRIQSLLLPWQWLFPLAHLMYLDNCNISWYILEKFRCIFGYSGKLKVSTTCATHSKNSWAAFCIVTISNFYICYSTIPRMRSNNFSAVASVFSSKKQSTKYFFPIQHVTWLLTAFKIQKCNICNSKIKCLKFFGKVSLRKMSIIERNGVVPKTISQYESSLAEYPKMHLKISWMYY